MALLMGYTCNGTPGATLTTGNSGFALFSAAPIPVFNAAGDGFTVSDGGSTTGSYCEDQTAGDWEAFTFMLSSLPVSTIDANIAFALNGATSMAALRVLRTSGFIAIYSGLSTLQATGTTALQVGVRYRIERQANAAGQRVLLYTETGSTPLDDLSGAVPSAVAITKRRYGHPQSAQSSGVVDIYSVGIYDAQPNLGAVSNAVFSKTVTIG